MAFPLVQSLWERRFHTKISMGTLHYTPDYWHHSSWTQQTVSMQRMAAECNNFSFPEQCGQEEANWHQHKMHIATFCTVKCAYKHINWVICWSVLLCCVVSSTLLAASRRLHILIHNQLIRMIVLGPSNPESDQQRDLLYFLHQRRNSRCVVKAQQHRVVPRRSLTAANSKFATSFCHLRLQRNQWQLWVPYLLAPTQVTLYPHHTTVWMKPARRPMLFIMVNIVGMQTS